MMGLAGEEGGAAREPRESRATVASYSQAWQVEDTHPNGKACATEFARLAQNLLTSLVHWRPRGAQHLGARSKTQDFAS
jgi:hypothetical protein